MNSLCSAYQAYERRVIRGEYDFNPDKTQKISLPPEPLMARLGDLLIQTGVKLKVRHATSKAMTWTPIMESKS